MTEINEITALSILFGNTLVKKRDVDLLTLSKNCDYLVKKYGNSRKNVAEKIGVSPEMVRTFLLAKEMPIEIQKLIAERKIDSLDIIKQISEIKNSEDQIIIANAILNLPSKDIRDVIRLIKKNKLNAEDAIASILKEKPKNYHVYLIDVDNEMNKKILNAAKKFKLTPGEFVKKIVCDWIAQNTDEV